MNKKLIGVLVIVVVLAGGYWYVQSGKAASEMQGTQQRASDFGTYAYECDEHVSFTATMSSDLASIRVKAANGGSYPPESTLMKKESTAGVRYEGNGIIFTGVGETVTLGEGDSAINCSPVTNPNEAPFNFGDPQGNVKQDTMPNTSEMLQGNWKSAEDAKFGREFKSDGVAVDMYDGKVVSSGTWKIFTKEKPISVSFPIDANAVYVQMKMSGTQTDMLNFRIGRMTDKELELIYMDRGGVLKFTRVK